VLDGEAWKALGACSGDSQFEDFPDRSDKKEVEYAKGVCRTCSVKPECLAYAFLHDIREGIWGGTFHEGRMLLGSILGLSKSMRLDVLSDMLRNQSVQETYTPNHTSYTDISVEFSFETDTQTLQISAIDLEHGTLDF
jgi:WhiB family transcriptional regulator, redox-sensing transcriptional regulator